MQLSIPMPVLMLAALLAPLHGGASAQPACPAAGTAVRGVYVGSPHPPRPVRGNEPPVATLGDTLTVVAEDLPALAAEAECRKQGLVLFLNGRPMVGVPTDPPADLAGGHISFPLVRTAETQGFWNHILGAPSQQFRTVAVSVGLDGRFAVPSSAVIRFNVLPAGLFWVSVALLLGALVGFCFLASRSNLLRDATAAPIGDEKRAFSAGRFQAAIWFFVVFACYLLVSVVTGDFLQSMSTGALAILGLSAATTAGSAAIDASKDTQQARHDKAALRATAGLVENDPLALRASGSSQGFLQDVLSDANGVTFQRFQLLVWSAALSAVFMWTTWKSLALPPLDTGLLGTYFVSAATFLGLKLPEPVVPRKA